MSQVAAFSTVFIRAFGRCTVASIQSMESKMLLVKKLLATAAALITFGSSVNAGALDVGETITLLVRGQPLTGFSEAVVPMCKNLDDLKTFTTAKLKFNSEYFCAVFYSGMKLKIIKKDGDYLCMQNAAPRYQGGNPAAEICFWMKMSPLDAIGAPPNI
jgi:hypothetical protein